jgi:uncharacterized membrane protein YkvA (DUF1232 family)
MTATQHINEAYAAQFSYVAFWAKLRAGARNAGTELLTRALALYYALQDPDTPKWAKAVILSALGYFIMPLDAFPDLVPFAGLADDALIVAGAFATVALHVKELHMMKVRAKLDEWFGRNGESIEV